MHLGEERQYGANCLVFKVNNLQNVISQAQTPDP